MIHPWTIPGIDTRLTELHADNSLSFRDIADLLNTEFGTKLTRHACIGRADRLQLPKRPSPILPKRAAPIPPQPEPTPEPEPEPPMVIGIPLIELRDFRDCHYPLGEMLDRPPYLYCGEPVRDGTSWCEAHYRKVYTPATQRWQ